MKQWQESPEGKAWISQAQQRQQSQRIGSVDRNGSLRIDNAVPGHYELGVMLKAKDGGLPWDRPELLRYSGEIIRSRYARRRERPTAGLGQRAARGQDAQETILCLGQAARSPSRGRKEQSANCGTIWTCCVTSLRPTGRTRRRSKHGKARPRVERRQVYGKEAVGQDYSATVQFVFDRARKSIRWNTTLEKWAKIVQGHDDPQPVPQIINGMMTPEGLYRFGSYESPGNPKNRPLVLTITSVAFVPGRPHEGQLQPQQYDFNPLYYYSLNQQHGDLVEGARALYWHGRRSSHGRSQGHSRRRPGLDRHGHGEHVESLHFESEPRLQSHRVQDCMARNRPGNTTGPTSCAMASGCRRPGRKPSIRKTAAMNNAR